jgi:hypothetical protein
MSSQAPEEKTRPSAAQDSVVWTHLGVAQTVVAYTSPGGAQAPFDTFKCSSGPCAAQNSVV